MYNLTSRLERYDEILRTFSRLKKGNFPFDE